jgi:hypothetical protein
MSSPKLQLVELPPAFLGVDALRHYGWSKEYGTKMLSSWVKQGVLERLAPRVDVYVQALRVPKGERLRAMLDATPLGYYRADPDVLRAYDLTTQRGNTLYAILPHLKRNCQPQVEVVLQARSTRWWKYMRKGLLHSSSALEEPHIHPAWLLAEAMFNTNSALWVPDPDDVDNTVFEEVIALEVMEEALQKMASYYGKTSPPQGLYASSFELYCAAHKNRTPSPSLPFLDMVQ